MFWVWSFAIILSKNCLLFRFFDKSICILMSIWAICQKLTDLILSTIDWLYTFIDNFREIFNWKMMFINVMSHKTYEYSSEYVKEISAQRSSFWKSPIILESTNAFSQFCLSLCCHFSVAKLRTIKWTGSDCVCGATSLLNAVGFLLIICRFFVEYDAIWSRHH